MVMSKPLRGHRQAASGMTGGGPGGPSRHSLILLHPLVCERREQMREVVAHKLLDQGREEGGLL
jgi:hypothetical protein